MRALTDSWTLGGHRIANRLVLAPLAGIGNWFIRMQARRHGAGLAVSEMVSSFGIRYGDKRTLREYLRIHPDEHPVSMQLFGHDPEVMRIAAEKVRDSGFRKWDVFTPFPVHGMDRAVTAAQLLKLQHARLLRHRLRARSDPPSPRAADRR